MGICIISRFAFAGRFTGGGVPVTLSALHYPPMKRCSAVALFESSPCQHKKQTPCRDTARGLFFYGAKQPKSEPLPSGASLAAISSKVMVFVPSL